MTKIDITKLFSSQNNIDKIKKICYIKYVSVTSSGGNAYFCRTLIASFSFSTENDDNKY